MFISGSAYEYGRFGDSGKDFIKDLSKALLKREFKLVSGFGLGVGTHIVEGALEEIYVEKKKKITDELCLFPFPLGNHTAPVWHSYRDHMLDEAGVALFIFGNKLEDISIKEADGVLKEFDIAYAKGSLLIPVGASGYAAERLWKRVVENYDDYFDTREKFELFLQLGTSPFRLESLIELILEIAN